MKKILLIIALTLCIFQMVVLATAIDIGSVASDRGASRSQTYTLIDKNNPANDSGTITSVEIWAVVSLDNCEVAIFTEGAANVFTTRDTHTIGTVTAGSKQTFSGLSLNVQAGDVIGIWWSSGSPDGALEYDNDTGDGYWYLSGDHIPCTDTTFNFISPRTISLYGIGATVEEYNAIFFGFNF